MLGGIRRAAVGSAVLGLTALGLATGPAPVQAGPVEDHACVVVGQPADVFNIEYGTGGQGHPSQPSNGSWINDDGVSVPRYGLYYPVTDPVATSHAVPRAENFGGVGGLPDTPIQTGDHFLFVQSGKCANTQNPLATGPEFLAKGSAIGYCGRSVGLGVGTVAGRTSVIRWESWGSQLVLLDPSARGSVNAQANPPGDAKGSCKDGNAITFLVDGVISDVRPAP